MVCVAACVKLRDTLRDVMWGARGDGVWGVRLSRQQCFSLTFTLLSGVRHGVWISFVILTVLHVLANRAALRCLAMRTLNPDRLGLVIPAALNTLGLDGSEPVAPAAGAAVEAAAPTPQWAAARESLLFLPPPLGGPAPPLRLHYGVSLSELPAAGLGLAELVKAHGGERFLIAPARGGSAGVTLAIAVREDRRPADELRAYIVAYMVARRLAAGEAWGTPLLGRALGAARVAAPRLEAALEGWGWEVGKVSLGGEPTWLGRW